MNTYRIQYKYWQPIWGTLQLWKCRSQRTYKATNSGDALKNFKRDKLHGRLPHNAEIIKIWQLVNE